MDSKSQIFKTLRASSLFELVDDTVLSTLSTEMSIQTLEGGDILIKQGEIADSMYLLVYGRLLVYQDHDETNSIGEIGAGDVVGELSLFIDTPRTATVCAIRDSALIKISRPLFESIAKNHPQAAMRILSSCVKRLLPNFKPKHHALKTLSIIPCDPHTDVEMFTQRLSSALSHYSKTIIMHQTDDLTQIYQLETEYDVMIYIADRTLSEWTKQCIRQSDRMLLLCDAKQPPIMDVVDYIHKTESIKAKTDLILQYAESTSLPSAVSKFMKKIKPHRHFNIATEQDVERLSRYLLGRSISVVFAGGGLRGVAHHGLVRALEERNIPIDMTAGVSFGSLLSFMVAHKYNQQKLYDVWETLAPEIEKVVDMTLPITSLARGKRLYELLVEAFGEDQCIEDLWLPSFCVSTNLTDYDAYVHQEGLTWLAIRASISLPVIFPPVVLNHKLLVDGASVNNLPVDLMKDFNNQGIVIASTVSEVTDNGHFMTGERGVSGWAALYDRLMHKPRRYPDIANISMDASLAASVRHQREMFAKADIALDLGVSEYGMLDVKSWRAVMEKGYENACIALDRMGITRSSLGL